MTAIKREERIGGQRLILGDCLEVMQELGPVDAVVTDPPYGVGLAKKTSRYSTAEAAKSYVDDEETIIPLVVAAIEIATSMASRVIVTPGTRLLTFYPRPVSIGTIFSPGAGGMDSWGFGCNNPILYYGKCPYLATGKGSRPNSFASNAANPYMEGRVDGHPCPKPLAWMEWLVSRASAHPGETILDPFMGSGTTLVACQKLGRQGIGIELDEDYWKVACERVHKAWAEPDLFIKDPTAPAPVQERLFDV